MSKQPSYYAILTADVRYDSRLSSSEKLFYAEVTALSNKTGQCWASNKYFADLYDVSKSTVSGWVRNLCECGYVDVDYEYDGKQIKKRFISIKDSSGVHLFEQGYSENTKGGIQNIEQGYSENLKDNSTSINNTSSNIPTVSDVRSYFSENGYSPDAGEKAYHYYNESVKGTQKQYWRDSNDKMIKNWKMKMRAVWFKPENEQNNNGVISAGEW